MLTKKLRLPIEQTRRELKKAYSSPYFLLKSSTNLLGHNRFGVIISVSSVKKSTRRHFWKRQILAAVERWPNMGKDFLIIASHKLENADKKVLRAELDRAFETLNPKP